MNETSGYKNYVERFGEPNLDFIENLPCEVNVLEGESDTFVATDKRFGEYLAQCVSHGVEVAPLSFVDFFFKKGEWYVYPTDKEEVLALAKESKGEIEPSPYLVENDVITGVFTKDYATFVEIVSEVEDGEI